MGYSNKKKSAAPSAAAPVAPKPGKKSGGSIWSMEIGGSKPKTDMKRLEVLLFVSELADLLEAGMTLGQALQALSNQGEENSARRFICRNLCEAIVRGENFSDACFKHPTTFEPLYGNMIRAAEASGAMVEVLRRLVEHYERNDSIRSKVKGALIYPCIVLSLGVVGVIRSEEHTSELQSPS